MHKLVPAGAGRPNRLYQQNHCGVYRSDDLGLNWYSIDTNGLPTETPSYVHSDRARAFGFPLVVHPQDPDTLYVVPVPEDTRTQKDVFAIWRSRDGGDSWKKLTRGLPKKNAYLGVLREGMCTDALGGIYCATSTGQIFFSRNDGDTWETIAGGLPHTYSVECAVI